MSISFAGNQEVDENNKEGEGQKEKPQPMDVNGKTNINNEILLKE